MPGLAVAALRDVDFDPGALNGVGIIGGESFDGGDVLARNAGSGATQLRIAMPSIEPCKRHTSRRIRVVPVRPSESRMTHKRRGRIVIHETDFPFKVKEVMNASGVGLM